MSELRKANYDAVFFISMTIVSWVDVFTRREYCEEIIKSIRFCQQHKGLELYAYVIMTNHIHWVAGQKDGRLIGVVARLRRVRVIIGFKPQKNKNHERIKKS